MKRVVVNGKSQLQADEHFRRFDVEAWIIGKLGNPPSITEGITDYATRKVRIRGEILNRGLENVPMVSKGNRETYSQVFERFYGEPLQSAEGKRT